MPHPKDAKDRQYSPTGVGGLFCTILNSINILSNS